MKLFQEGKWGIVRILNYGVTVEEYFLSIFIEKF